MAGTRAQWAAYHDKAVRGRKRLSGSDLMHGVDVGGGQHGYGDVAGGSYPTHKGKTQGWAAGGREQDQDAADQRDARERKAREDARKAQPSKQTDVQSGRQQADGASTDAQRRFAERHTPEARAMHEAQWKELQRGQGNYQAPVQAPKLAHKDLIEFNDKLPNAVLQFEDTVRQHADNPKAVDAKKKLVAALDKTLKTYRRHIAESIETARDIKPRSTEGRSALADAETHLSAAQSYIDGALDEVESKDQLSVGVRIFRLAHIELKSGLASIDITLQDVDAVADRQIKHWTFVRQACEASLTLLGGAVELGATTVFGKVVEAGTAKIVLAAVPALDLGAEKISSEWNGVPTNITWAEVLKKATFDVILTKIGNVMDTQYFSKIDYFKQIEGLSDPNLRAWALKNISSISSSLLKELLQRVGSRVIEKHYYGKPAADLTPGLAEAAWQEYTLDTTGCFLRAIYNASIGK